MTIEEVKTLYDEREGNGSFADHVTRCLFLGVLVKRDEFLLMAEPVLTDGKRVFWEKPPRNCWWIYFAMGPKGATAPGDFQDEAPYPLPFVAFKRRRGKIRIYRWDRIRKDIKDGRRRRSLSTTST